MKDEGKVREGLMFGLAAHACWGGMPLYFRLLLSHVGTTEQLVHRILWSAVLLAAFLTFLHKWPELVRAVTTPRTFWLLLGATAFIAVNWYVFLYGLSTGRALHNSLGYFANPLFNVALGVLVLGERLRPPQWLALALAACGIAVFSVSLGELPWIALTVASSFAFYGLMRKLAAVDGLVGLTVETVALAPACVVWLGWMMSHGEAKFFEAGWVTDVLLVLSGLVTVVPLWFFVLAATRLQLSTLGFLQYIGPTLQFFIAIYVFHEEANAGQLGAFVFIWAALGVFSADALLHRPVTPPAAPPPPDTGTGGRTGTSTAIAATRR
jgi:chloramphenicol-sensitive protein RarD